MTRQIAIDLLRTHIAEQNQPAEIIRGGYGARLDKTRQLIDALRPVAEQELVGQGYDVELVGNPLERLLNPGARRADRTPVRRPRWERPPPCPPDPGPDACPCWRHWQAAAAWPLTISARPAAYRRAGHKARLTVSRRLTRRKQQLPCRGKPLLRMSACRR